MVRAQFSDRTPPSPSPRRTEASIAFADDSWSTKEDEESTIYVKLAVWNRHQCRGAAGGASRNALGEPSIQTWLSATSQLLDKHASPNIGSNTSKFNNILEHDLFLYRLSHRRKSQLRLCPGETSHRECSGLTTTCGCLFGFVCKKKPTKLERFSREESSQRAPPFFVDGGSIN